MVNKVIAHKKIIIWISLKINITETCQGHKMHSYRRITHIRRDETGGKEGRSGIIGSSDGKRSGVLNDMGIVEDAMSVDLEIRRPCTKALIWVFLWRDNVAWCFHLSETPASRFHYKV